MSSFLLVIREFVMVQVDEAAVNALEKRLRSINSLATTYRTTKSAVPVDYVLGIGGFDLDRVSEEVCGLAGYPMRFLVNRLCAECL